MVNKLKESPLELLWEKEIEGSITKVAFDEGNVVVGTNDGLVKCFDSEGNLKWEYRTESEIIAIDASNSHLVATSKDSNIYLLDMEGNLKWRHKHETYGLCCISNNYILAGCSLFDINGNLKWNKEIPFASGHLSDNYVAFGSNVEDVDGYYVYLFDITGNLKWKHPVDDEVNNIQISDEYVMAAAGYFYLFDMDGNLKMDKIICDDFCKLEDYIAIGSAYGNVSLININEGKLEWNREIRAVDSKDELEDITENTAERQFEYDNNTYIIGDEIWNIDPEFCGMSPYTKPHIWTDFIFVSSTDNYFYLFDMDGNLKWKENILVNVLNYEYHDLYSSFFKDNLLIVAYDHHTHTSLFKLLHTKNQNLQ